MMRLQAMMQMMGGAGAGGTGFAGGQNAPILPTHVGEAEDEEYARQARDPDQKTEAGSRACLPGQPAMGTKQRGQGILAGRGCAPSRRIGTEDGHHHTHIYPEEDARDHRGMRVASGAYIYVIEAGEFRDRRKMLLLK